MAESTNIVLGTAGHIDHGKTALVRALTGIDTDRLPQEKARGITIDLGFARLQLGERQVSIVDVPGHERFIRNMLAGATAIDLALLVIAADDSIMPQTREHLEILRLLGVTSGLIALTKCDLVDPAWLELVEAEVRDLVADTFLHDKPIIRTVAPQNRGIPELRQAIEDCCDAFAPRDDLGFFRMSIDRVFAREGHGTVVTGTIASGRVSVGDELEAWPDGAAVRVRGIQRHDQKHETLARGARAALNLAGVHHSQLARGFELATPGFLTTTPRLTVRVRANNPSAPLRNRQRYRLHIGTAEHTCRLILPDLPDADPAASRIGQLIVAQPVSAVFGQPFVLRQESPPATLGGGVVVEPTARRLRRRDFAALPDSDSRDLLSPPQRLEAALVRARLTPQSDAALARETGLAPPDIAKAQSDLLQTRLLVELPVASRRTMLLPVAYVASLEDRILRILAKRHAAKPRASVIRRQDVTSVLADLDSDALVAALLDRLRQSGRIAATESHLALKGHSPTLSQAEARTKNKLLDLLRAGGFSPPTRDELISSTRASSAVVDDLLALLEDEAQAVKISNELWLGTAHAAELERITVERLTKNPTTGVTMAELRDLLATTRKYAVPIGEYLDRAGITRREGDQRFLNNPPTKPHETAHE